MCSLFCNGRFTLWMLNISWGRTSDICTVIPLSNSAFQMQFSLWINNEKHPGMSRHIDRQYNFIVLPAKVNTYTTDMLCPGQGGVTDYSFKNCCACNEVCGFKMTQGDCAQHLLINNVTTVRFSSYLGLCTITLRLDKKTPPYVCLKTLEVTTVACTIWKMHSYYAWLTWHVMAWRERANRPKVHAITLGAVFIRVPFRVWWGGRGRVNGILVWETIFSL